MNALPTLPVILPLLGGALLAAAGKWLSRRLGEGIALAVACAVLVIDLELLARSLETPIVYWFGGFWPRAGAALGIDFAIDPFGAGFATLSALLVALAIVFALRFFDSAHSLLHALLLVFLAALGGFGFTGDLFNLFVFFELMGACAFALCGYKTREEGPIQGAINFAVVNTVGAYLVLLGIALLYARTGALNLAQIGRGLRGERDPLVVASFTLVGCGFFVKAALVPFHFWLADAHAVAPTPVCVLFSGAMVEAGLYAVARVYGAVFAPSFRPFEGGVRLVLLVLGATTAVIGGFMCFEQRHIKRLLAYSTSSHAGTMTVGLALLDAKGLGGAGLYALAHGCIKGSLFFCAGIVLHRLRSVDELALRGRGRALPLLGALIMVGGYALAGGPPFGLWIGARTIDEAAKGAHAEWATTLATIGAVLTGAAVVRVALSVFAGWGTDRPEEPGIGGEPTEEPETPAAQGRVPLAMWAPAVGLLVAALAIGLLPRWALFAEQSARHVLDSEAYAHWVIDGVVPSAPPAAHVGPSALAHGLVAGFAAIALAAATLFRASLPRPIVAPIGRAWRAASRALRRVHTGRVGDYLAWLVLGVAVLGGGITLAVR